MTTEILVLLSNSASQQQNVNLEIATCLIEVAQMLPNGKAKEKLNTLLQNLLTEMRENAASLQEVKTALEKLVNDASR